MAISRRLSRFLACFLLATGILAAMLAWQFVYLRGLPIPVGDQWWETVHVAALTHQGRLSANDIFAYFEGHRPANIRLIASMMTLLTGYNLLLLNYIT